MSAESHVNKFALRDEPLARAEEDPQEDHPCDERWAQARRGRLGMEFLSPTTNDSVTENSVRKLSALWVGDPLVHGLGQSPRCLTHRERAQRLCLRTLQTSSCLSLHLPRPDLYPF